EPAPVGVGLLGDDLSFFHEPLQDAVDFEPVAPPLEPECQVLEVDEHCQGSLAVRHTFSQHGHYTRLKSLTYFVALSFFVASSTPSSATDALGWPAGNSLYTRRFASAQTR